MDFPPVEDAAEVTPEDGRELSKLFLDRLQSLEEGTSEHSYVRGTLIEMNMSPVRFSARRLRGRGPEEQEDILQVGTIGLIKAIDRFDLSREVEFTTFAVPYIVGEMKRHFRDTTRRGPRAAPPPGVEDGTGQGPGPPDGRAGRPARRRGTRRVPGTRRGPRSSLVRRTVGATDPAMSLVEDFHALAPLLSGFDDRERQILQLRFGQEMTQAEIGAEIGYAQMHVSRLLSKTLSKLRSQMLSDE
jgi:RNA polymerase sigma-B factor